MFNSDMEWWGFSLNMMAVLPMWWMAMIS